MEPSFLLYAKYNGKFNIFHLFFLIKIMVFIAKLHYLTFQSKM
jgi:hypothetical protein